MKNPEIKFISELDKEVDHLVQKGYEAKTARDLVAYNDHQLKQYVEKALSVDKAAFWESLSDIGTSIGYDRTAVSDFMLLAAYVNDDVVHTCISMNAGGIASLDYGVYSEDPEITNNKSLKKLRNKKLTKVRKSNLRSRFRNKNADELVEYPTHPLFDLLQNKEEDLNAHDFFRLTVTYLDMLGRAYWNLLREGTEGTPEGIRMLKPWYVYPFRDLDGAILDYFYINSYAGTSGGAASSQSLPSFERVFIEKENIIDFRWPAPSDPYAGGDSPLRAAYLKIALNDKFHEWMNYVLSNRARIDGILSVDDSAEENRKRIETEFLNKFRGSGNGGVMTVDGTKIKFNPVTYSPTDLAALDIAEALATAVPNALGIPPALISGDPKYSNLENSKEQWQRGKLLPTARLIEAQINKYLLPLVDDSGDTFFAFDNPVPEDAAFELEQEKAADQLFIACIAANPAAFDINEIRERVGLEEWGAERLAEVHDNTPEEPEDQEASEQETPEDEKVEGEREQLGANANPKNLDALLELNREVSKGSIPRAIAINIAEAWGFPDARNLIGHPVEQQKCTCGCENQKAQKEESKINSVMAGYFRHLKQECFKVVSKSFSASNDKADTSRIPEAFTEVQHWAKNLKNTPEDLAYKVKPLIEVSIQTAADGKKTSLERVGASPDAFSVLPQKIEDYANRRSLRLAQSTLDTVADGVTGVVDSIKQEIMDGILEGDSINALKRSIGEYFDDAAEWKADQIARTENSAALHMGQVAAAKASGIVKGFQYLVSSDACPVCQDYSDKQISLDDYDDSGVVDADGAVPLHPNCTCTLEELLTDDEEGNEADND